MVAFILVAMFGVLVGGSGPARAKDRITDMLPPLHTLWDYHDRGEFGLALEAFQKAVKARREQGDTGRLRIARWCIGRCLRSLARNDEAIEIQQDLERQMRQMGKRGGFVFEELAELHHAGGDSAKTVLYFRQAYAELSENEWLVKN